MTHQPNDFFGFVKDRIYVRRELHDQFGGQRQGGISTPRNHPMIFLFTGQSGEEHGYGYDEQRSADLYYYTGEGQSDKGDMTFSRGNRAIRDHENHGKRLFLFEQLPNRAKNRGKVRFICEMRCKGFHIEERDTAGVAREVIVFELTPIND